MPAPLTAPTLTLRPSTTTASLASVYFSGTHADQTNVAFYRIEGCKGVGCTDFRNISGMGLALAEIFYDPLSSTPALSTDPTVPNRYRAFGVSSLGEPGPYSNIITHYPGTTKDIDVFSGSLVHPAQAIEPLQTITHVHNTFQVADTALPAGAIPTTVFSQICAGKYYSTVHITLANGTQTDFGSWGLNSWLDGTGGQSGLGFDEILCQGFRSVARPLGGWTRANLLAATFGWVESATNPEGPPAQAVWARSEVQKYRLRVSYVLQPDSSPSPPPEEPPEVTEGVPRVDASSGECCDVGTPDGSVTDPNIEDPIGPQTPFTRMCIGGGVVALADPVTQGEVFG